jgi:hypothetical protein
MITSLTREELHTGWSCGHQEGPARWMQVADEYTCHDVKELEHCKQHQYIKRRSGCFALANNSFNDVDIRRNTVLLPPAEVLVWLQFVKAVVKSVMTHTKSIHERITASLTK